MHTFYSKSHKCYQKGYDFHANEFKRTLQEMKDTIYKQRVIAHEMVDRIAHQTSFRRKHRSTKPK